MVTECGWAELTPLTDTVRSLWRRERPYQQTISQRPQYAM